MNTKFLLAFFVTYFISGGMNFLIYSEGDFQTDLSGKLLRAAITGLGVPLVLIFSFWWQQRKNRKSNAD